MEIAREVWSRWALEYGDRTGSATGPLIRAIAEAIEHDRHEVLVKVEHLREENSRLKKAITKAANEGLSHD